MGLHPDNAVCFKRAPGHRVTVPEDSSSFQAPPPAAVALGLPEYKPLLSFSMTFSPSWRNLGQSLSLPASCFLSTNGNDSSYFSYSQDSCEDPLRKLIWKSYEMITRFSVCITHPNPSLRDVPGPVALGGKEGQALGWRAWDTGAWAERTQKNQC